MRRIMIIIAYEGTAYAGFQIQPTAPTIEGILNATLTQCLHEDIRIIGASRTDAGVHALGNVAVFDTESRVPADKVSIMLNQHLPMDIRIMDSKEVDLDFHPRKTSCRKTYEYKIQNTRTCNPLLRHDTYFYYRPLDAIAMDEAAKRLIGEHDFTSYASIHKSTLTSVRTIYDASVKREGDIITITVTGNGFLYNMVRIIAGTLIEVGQGKLSADDVTRILEAKDREEAADTAPAVGLTLKEIVYQFSRII